MRVLVSGISGLGGHLAPHLLAAGREVVGLSSHPSRVAIDVPVMRADAVDGDGLDEAMRSDDVAYFLIHSYEQDSPEGFAARDRLAAQHFAAAARRAGVERPVADSRRGLPQRISARRHPTRPRLVRCQHRSWPSR